MDVRIEPPEGGLVAVSHALPYQVRAISRSRLAKSRVAEKTLSDVIARVHLLRTAPQSQG